MKKFWKWKNQAETETAPAERTLFLIRSNAAVQDRLRGGEKLLNEQVVSLCESGLLAGKYAEFARPAAAFERFLESNVTVHVDSLSYGMSGRRLGGIFGFRTRHMVSYADNLRLLCEDVTRYREGGYRIAVIAENETAARSLADLFADAGIPAAIPAPGSADTPDAMPRGTVLIHWRSYLFGYELMVPRIAILSTNPDSRTGSLSTSPAVLRSRKRAADEARRRNTRTILSFNDLEPGDLVVHESYGIGRFTGIENLTAAGVSRDYIGIQYAGTDKLYIPVEKLDMVSKYIGAHADDGMIKLSKLGTDGWNRTKAKTKAVVREMAKDLISLYAERMRRPGHAFAPDSEWQREFEENFGYTETDDQLRCTAEIKGDMESSVPMDRLLCGDVGFGKTEVAMRAVMKCVLDGKQAAILVPTTVLAQQHYQTAVARFRGFPVTIDVLSRFRTPKMQQQTLQKLRAGSVDLIIGTHKLLQKTVQFKDLGLLIVDEEQRFGVSHKERLKEISKGVDVLTLSATPIPRTLNMALSGIRDMSTIEQPPADRYPVQTFVMEYSEPIVDDAIRREIERGGQVYYLHNRTETIDQCAAAIKRRIPDISVGVAHGQMGEDALGDVMQSMAEGEIQVLVCTTIIETGLDIPNANTLIIENADRFGLSQLHQLRGRVGRSTRHAYAYFTYRPEKNLTEVAEKRLSAIRDFAEFGSGFKIAMRDLEIRGAGNLLGAEQSGHMSSVGYDMYLKLLDEAVLEEKGEAPKAPECTADLNVTANVDKDYVSRGEERMDLYRRMAAIRSQEDADDLLDEIVDRYGEPPKGVLNLIDIALLRAKARQVGIKDIRQKSGDVLFTLSNLNFEAVGALCSDPDYKQRVTFLASAKEPTLRFKLANGVDSLKQSKLFVEHYTSFFQS